MLNYAIQYMSLEIIIYSTFPTEKIVQLFQIKWVDDS
jgi:hypothetical protein